MRIKGLLYSIHTLLIFHFIPFSVLISQPNEYQGIVVSSSSKAPVRYAIIKGIQNQFGTITDSLGQFQLKVPKRYENDSIVISSIGHKDTILALQNFTFHIHDSIELKEQPYVIPEIVISGQKLQPFLAGNTKMLNVKKENKKRLSGLGMQTFFDFQIARFIPNPKHKAGYIKSIHYYIHDYAIPNTPFRIRLYKNENGQPGSDLLRINLITSANQGGTWYHVMLDTLDIPIPLNGFFVAMEWIDWGDQYHFREVHYNKKTKQEIEYKIYGQILGMTLFDDQESQSYTFSKTTGEHWESWGQSDPGDTTENESTNVMHYAKMDAMIYATLMLEPR